MSFVDDAMKQRVKGPKFWNSLSPELSNSNSIHIFKKRLKRNF